MTLLAHEKARYLRTPTLAAGEGGPELRVIACGPEGPSGYVRLSVLAPSE